LKTAHATSATLLKMYRTCCKSNCTTT